MIDSDHTKRIAEALERIATALEKESEVSSSLLEYQRSNSSKLALILKQLDEAKKGGAF